MLTLFAGLDSTGQLRFIGDVPRGLACGCRCPVCGSALVAKQGAEKDWHFAHEAGQERPECQAGAANLLRRLAVAYLQGKADLTLPVFRRELRARSLLANHSEVVSRAPKLISALQPAPSPVRSGPVLHGVLDGNVPLCVAVEISPEPPAATTEADSALLSLVCRLPDPGQVRTLDQAMAFLADTSVLVWRWFPDADGQVQAAEQRLQALVLADEETLARNRRAPLPAPEGWRPAGGAAPDAVAQGAAALRSVGTPIPDSFDWAPERKPNTSFVFYRLKDGPAWILYTLQDGSMAAVAPDRQPGWETALRHLGAELDPALGVLRVPDRIALQVWLGQRAGVVRTGGDPREFDAL